MCELRYKTSFTGLDFRFIVGGMNGRNAILPAPDADGDINPEGLIEKVAAFYHKALKGAQKARAWLKRRGLDGDGLREQWLVGTADGRLLQSLPTDGKGPVGTLRALGVLTPAGGEYFVDGITLPVRDGDGGIVTLTGVSFKEEDRILSTSPTALWNAPAVRLYPELILTTRLLDALSLHQAGFPQTCAVVGAHLKPQDLALLHDAGVRKILLLGIQATGTLLSEQLAAFSVRAHPLSTHAFMMEKGLPELVTEVDRLLAVFTGKVGDGRMERLNEGFSVSFGRRRYEDLGVDKNARRLKVTIKTERSGKLHVDTLDLYHAKSRKTLLQDLSCFFEESPAVVDGDIAKLINFGEEFVPGQGISGGAVSIVAMTEVERREAESFGKADDLMELILQDYRACGLVGEESNILLCYLAAISRKTDEPISVLVLSSSGAGKSALQDATLRLCPPEDVVKLTSLTGRALFYKGAGSLKHKILALEEEAGVRQASYAIRNLISAGELIIETTVKDLGSGRLTTMQNRVEGPTTVLITTTNPDVDPETKSRFFVTGVDESREQTRAILESQRQRRTWEGKSGRDEREAIRRRHWNFQRILKPVAVVNPFAGELRYSDDRLQSRRDQPKYLNLINAVAFMRQMQKPVKNHNGREYVEVDETDLELANKLAEEILGQNLDDLNRVSRDLLAQIERMVGERMALLTDPEQGHHPRVDEITFTRRDIREFTGWPHMRVARYLKQLVDMELVVARSGRNGWRYVYTLERLLARATEGNSCQKAPDHLITTLPAPYQSKKQGQLIEQEEVAQKSYHLTTKGDQ
jgi:DNA primase